MTRLLVTGASGLLGANLMLDAAEEYDIVAQYHQHAIHDEHVQTVRADLRSQKSVEHLVEDVSPDWIVHCAAATDIDSCERGSERAFRLNAELPAWVAQIARSIGARMVHVSTDAVFDGKRDCYSESDAPHPINVYAESKLAGEEAVRSTDPEALIVRTNIYGWNAQPKSSLAEFFLKNLESGRPCRGFTDVCITPLLANDLARIILEMLERNLSGLYHVAGSECVSKFEFGQRVARVFGRDESLIKPISVEDAGLQAKRSKRMCLDCSRVEATLDQQMPGVQVGLESFKRMRQTGFRTRLKEISGGEDDRK